MEHTASLGTGPIPQLVARLPAGFDLEGSARRHGAFSRARRIKSGTELLHLALTYGTGALSRRDTAAWATRHGAALSDVAVLGRLRSPGVAAWLQATLAALLAARQNAAPGWRVRILDATTVSGPGGAAYRLHAGYDLAGQHLTALEVTDGTGGESLRRFAIGPGEIAVADRAYLQPRALRAVRAAEGHFVVRAGWNAARWRTADDTQPFDLFGFLDRLAWGEQAEAAIVIRPERGRRDAFPARLVVRRLDWKAAAAARRRARRAASKDQRRLQPQTLKAAEFVLLVTSLDAAAFPAGEILALYRRRWQIELAFKRLKSLFGLDRLPAKDPDLARTWLYAKLLAHFLAEDLTRAFLTASPSDHRAGAVLLDLARPEDTRHRPLRRDPRRPRTANLDRA